MSESDRREGERHLACFPAGLKRGDGGEPALALIRDVSVSGALLFTRKTLTEGETIGLELHIAASSEQAREANATVVRVTRRPPEEAGVWRFSVAVRFEPPLDGWREEVEALKHQLPPTPLGKA